MASYIAAEKMAEQGVPLSTDFGLEMGSEAHAQGEDTDTGESTRRTQTGGQNCNHAAPDSKDG